MAYKIVLLYNVLSWAHKLPCMYALVAVKQSLILILNSLSTQQPCVLCSFNTWIFFHHRIKIQQPPPSFHLQPPTFFYLQTITNYKITDPHITRNNFFVWKDKSQQRMRRRGYWRTRAAWLLHRYPGASYSRAAASLERRGKSWHCVRPRAERILGGVTRACGLHDGSARARASRTEGKRERKSIRFFH